MRCVPDEEAEYDLEKLRPILEVKDIQPELTTELVQLSEWYSRYFYRSASLFLKRCCPVRLKRNIQKHSS